MARGGTFKVSEITDADKSRAVKRSLAVGASKIRITEGQRRAIVAGRRKTRVAT